MQFLVSAGEASGDMYAAGATGRLRLEFPDAQFYGCAGPQLRASGVQPVIDAASLGVVGLAEVVTHLPRIYGQYRKLVAYARDHRPDAALLTDNPDFHLRVARHMKRMDVPVFYLVAPQVWAWRQGRVKTIRKLVDKLFCLFPFEEAWFRERGVDATYIGHPLAFTVRRNLSKDEFLGRHGLPRDRRTVVLLPGSRIGEAGRHLPILLETVRILKTRYDLSFVLAVPKGFVARGGLVTFREPISALSIKVLEDESWDAIGHADVALAASGTVTVEAAILGTPMVTFYRVMPVSWHLGRGLVKVPFLSMVNLIAGRRIVPELIQNDMTPGRLAGAAGELLSDDSLAGEMRRELASVRTTLTKTGDPFGRVASAIAASMGAASRTRSHQVLATGRE